jgi:Fe-S-cluster containining protein
VSERNEDLEAGLRFSHQLEMETKLNIYETGIRVLAVLEEVLAKGLVDEASLVARTKVIRERELARMKQQPHIKYDTTPDKYALTDLPQIDCEARLPLCKGRCCTLLFALSRQDLEEGVIRWELGKPYQIKQTREGRCVHMNSTTRFCSVYEHRPAVCRTYSCRTDKRIWIDFDKRIPAPQPVGRPTALAMKPET